MRVELHATSAYSFMRGASLPEDLAERAAGLGFRAMAVLDHGGVYGAPRFYQAARTCGLHPIVGAVVHVVASGVRAPIGLYVRDRDGYRALTRMLTHAHASAPKEYVRRHGLTVPLEVLAENKAGLTASLLAGEGPLASLSRGQSPAVAWARAVTSVLGTARTVVEHIRPLTRDGARTAARLVHLAELLRVPAIATNDVHYTSHERAIVADVLASARHYTTLERAGTKLAANRERHVKSPIELHALFADAPASIAAAERLADACAFTLDDLGYELPEIALADGETAGARLRRLVRERAPGRFRPYTKAARKQLAHELDLIEKMKFPGYFLIVGDIVDECRRRGILVQGRGSAANSAVCYALGITAVDPVQMHLLFERFLSEERGEWPDIDLDLPSGEHREAIIQYVYERYGASGVAMTANVITYRTRSAIREAGKALGFPEETLGRLSKQIGSGPFGDDDMAARFEAAGFSVQDPKIAHLIRASLGLQGLPRHLGQHPGGMVIARGRLDEIVPIEPATMPNRTVIQWDKDDCADLKILKVDLLGLGMMAVLESTFPTVLEHDGVDLSLATVPADDSSTYDMLCEADTIGVFQVESRAQMATLPRLQPRKFYDLVVEVAIIRPGPIVGKMVHPYIERHAGRADITYPHEELRPVLERTLGIPLFQEQLMRIAMVAAGFSGGEAEELRRAMGSKRSVEKMKSIEQKLRSGMTTKGIEPEAQDEIVRGIASFALYGFPESHAASFALLAYASAYLKCHHPASFVCELLNHWPMGFYHPSTLVKDAQRHRVKFRPVDVTLSGWNCTREPGGPLGTVRIGLRYVDGLRRDVGEAIVRERDRSAYRSIDDFARRSGARGPELATLAELGALASLPRRANDGADTAWTRRSALWQVAAIAAKPRGALFDRVESDDGEASPLGEMSHAERIGADYRASGLTVGKHPLALHREALGARGVVPVREFLESRNGTPVAVAGAVITRQRPGTAKGFFFMTIEDESGIANAIVAPRLYEAHRTAFATEPVVVLHGVVQQQDGVTSLKVSHVVPWQAEDVVLPDGHDFH